MSYVPHRDAPIERLAKLCTCGEDRAMHAGGGPCDFTRFGTPPRCSCDQFRSVLTGCTCEHCNSRVWPETHVAPSAPKWIGTGDTT